MKLVEVNLSIMMLTQKKGNRQNFGIGKIESYSAKNRKISSAYPDAVNLTISSLQKIWLYCYIKFQNL